jgi:hypothetical protein
MTVISIDPLAPYKLSDDLVLELVSVTAIIKVDPENAAAAGCWAEIVEPQNLALQHPPAAIRLTPEGSNDLRQERQRSAS